MAEPTKQKFPPTEERLKLLVANGAECIDLAQRAIDEWKLPYIIEKLDVLVGEQIETRFELRSSYTGGELYLQKFITVDQATLAMKQDALKAAKTPYEVLITGETGTGKELIAKSQIGDRKGQIRAINCAGMPEDLLESELFGHVAGAFTGAIRTKEGLISEAEDGVMFLDEVGELSLAAQGKLLRVLQEKTIRKVGGVKEEKVNCKFVFATNRDLREMVKEKRFKQDLFARLSTLELHIEPLRERRCDVIPITEALAGGKAFLEKYRSELEEGLIDLSLNVRSIEQAVIRYNVFGRVKIER